MPRLSIPHPLPFLVALLLLLVAPLAFADWVPTTRQGEELPRKLPPAQIVCDGQDQMAIADETMEVQGIGILADGNCVLELTNVDVKSVDSFALVVKGQARVTIRDSTFEGPFGVCPGDKKSDDPPCAAAVGMDGTAVIDATNSEFFGGFVRTGDGSQFTEDGSNGFWQAPLEELLING